jgi:hypothetical protein
MMLKLRLQTQQTQDARPTAPILHNSFLHLCTSACMSPSLCWTPPPMLTCVHQARLRSGNHRWPPCWQSQPPSPTAGHSNAGGTGIANCVALTQSGTNQLPCTCPRPVPSSPTARRMCTDESIQHQASIGTSSRTQRQTLHPLRNAVEQVQLGGAALTPTVTPHPEPHLHPQAQPHTPAC